MTRRLLLLNLVLLAAVGLAGWRMRALWEQARLREEALLRRGIAQSPPPSVLVPAAPAPVTASTYVDVAARLLFSKDRNPNVVIEPPAPKPMPPLPRYFGAMNFGQGLRVVLAEKGATAQKSYVVGDSVGDFKLLEVTREGLVWEWEGKRVAAAFAEMKPKPGEGEPAAPAPAATAAAAPAAAKPGATVIGAKDEEDAPARKPCDLNDGVPNGGIVNGLRKVVAQTPFAKYCFWEKAR